MLQNKDLNSYKVNVKAASTANVFITSIFPIVDGYQTKNGDRVLLKNQNDPKTNGIYICYKNGMTLDTDADNNTSYINGAFTRATNGIENLHKEFYCPPINPSEYYTTYKLWDESPFGGGGSGGASGLPIAKYVYLVEDADDATLMGDVLSNVYTNAQAAYDAARDLNPALVITNAVRLTGPTRIQITTLSAHGYVTGQRVNIVGLTGGTPATANINGNRIITVTGPTTFTYSTGISALAPYGGGAIVRTANKIVINVGNISQLASGNIVLTEPLINIYFEGIDKNVSYINTITGDGYAITLNAKNINIASVINTPTTNTNNVPAIFVSAANSYISSINNSANTLGGSGGDVIIVSQGTLFDNITSNGTLAKGGNCIISNGDSLIIQGTINLSCLDTGNGGNISISEPYGVINISDIISNSGTTTGNAGNISLYGNSNARIKIYNVTGVGLSVNGFGSNMQLEYVQILGNITSQGGTDGQCGSIYLNNCDGSGTINQYNYLTGGGGGNLFLDNTTVAAIVQSTDNGPYVASTNFTNSTVTNDFTRLDAGANGFNDFIISDGRVYTKVAPIPSLDVLTYPNINFIAANPPLQNAILNKLIYINSPALATVTDCGLGQLNEKYVMRYMNNGAFDITFTYGPNVLTKSGADVVIPPNGWIEFSGGNREYNSSL